MIVTNERDRPGPERNETHKAHLGLCKTQKERVRYCCEILARPRPESADVLDMLELYGYITNRKNQTANVRTLVSKWRAEHGMADTGGAIPPMTPEMLELLDERAAASETADANPRPRPLKVVREPELEASEPANADANPVREPAPADANLENSRKPAPAAQPTEETPVPMPAEIAPAPAREVPAAWVPAGLTGAAKLSKAARMGAYFASLVTLGVSAEASLRFFKERFGVPDPVRFFLFGGMEISLIVCALFMAAGMRSERGKPGPARMVAWGLCGFAVLACMDLYGPLDGPLRAIGGPILSMVMLHLALGLEWRDHHSSDRNGTLARIAREYRERFLSRLGLGNDQRDAVTRTRERAALRFAHLTEARFVAFRTARLRRAARAANLAHDPEMKARALREHAIISDLKGLKNVEHNSTW